MSRDRCEPCLARRQSATRANRTPGVTALIVGAGSIDGAWTPITTALSSFASLDLTPDMANAFLSRLVYLLRWHSSGRQVWDGAARAREELFDTYSHVCEAIRGALIEAETLGRISARPELSTVIDRLVLPDLRQLMFINTNWDTVADRAVENQLLRTHLGRLIALHVHGCAVRGQALYLPSELTQEPYRSAEEDSAIGTIHGQIMSGLESAERVVIYGLSLDPLDAELSQTLAAGWSNSVLREIHIVDPHHELVAGRVRLLMDPRHSAELVCHDPSEFG